MKILSGILLGFTISAFLLSCNKIGNAGDAAAQPLFTLLSPNETGIDFKNLLDYNDSLNCYTYRSFYNGGGVAIGDVNNDGLPDIYLTGNLQKSRLYLNRGNFKFEDVTDKAGVGCEGVWATGATFVDINGDGLLDLYVCKSGPPVGTKRYNELFINNGDGTFTEKAKEYGLDNVGLSTHAVFFDYDHDGDLDCYLLNNSMRSVVNFDAAEGARDVRDPEGGNKLLRNDGGHFTDVSAKAGIYGSAIGFGLGVTIGDVNRDGWDDIYVSNDFFEKDYLYINNHDGTFTESLESQIREISKGAMGADIADLNNDGYPEIFVTEMCPEREDRLKTKAQFDSWNQYQLLINKGFYKQFGRNTLQLNNGNGTFSELGRYAGVSATDWSWGALIFDMDNDGNKDIFVANGIYKDLLDQDYSNFRADPNSMQHLINEDRHNAIKRLVDMIPTEALPNYAYRNEGDMRFTNKAREWGLGKPSFSNGAAYVDLNNDGAMDLVVNNANMEAFVYRNEGAKLNKNRWLKFNLVGEGMNRFAVGAQITVWAKGKSFYVEHNPMKGFESSMDYRPNIGLGDAEKADSIIVEFIGGKRLVLKDVPTNQMLTIKQSDAHEPTPFYGQAYAFGKTSEKEAPKKAPVFKEATDAFGVNFKHEENAFSDFDIEPLLFQMHSAEGPKICKGDVNGDGLEDVFIGGAKGQAGKLYLQQPNGQFVESTQPAFAKDTHSSDDVDAVFFDADGDGDLDLLVASGGSDGENLDDRFYQNDGRGHFTRDMGALPSGKPSATSCVRIGDFDGDGFPDIFEGMRLKPGSYGTPVGGYLLKNDGKGHFAPVTPTFAPGLRDLGMVTDAAWIDYDGDGHLDLVVAQDWGSIEFFRNDHGHLVNATAQTGLPKTNGCWNTIQVGDFNGDGKPDLVIGNHGLNSRFKASSEKPATLYVNDFDGNGRIEQITCAYNGEKSYPCVLRQNIVTVMPGLKKKFLYFKDYGNKTIDDIFTPAQLKGATKLECDRMESVIMINQGSGKFSMHDLPAQAQYAPVYAISVGDFDHDGKQDILLGGNLYRSKPEAGIYDASYGLLLKGDGTGTFTPVSANHSGILVKGEVRDIVRVKGAKGDIVLWGMNDAKVRGFRY